MSLKPAEMAVIDDANPLPPLAHARIHEGSRALEG